MPSDERYDRQLRLWGARGQSRLTRARALALGATPSTCEALKNLILGGIASFLIVDDDDDDGERAREVFEIASSSVDARAGAASLAWACARALGELNPETRGAAERARAGDVVARGVEFLRGFDCVVVDGGVVSDAEVEALERACAEAGAVMATTRAAGLFGECRLSANARWATENVAPEGSVTKDLRVMKPWGELQAYAEMKTSDLDRLDAAAFKHVPFVALLASAAERGNRDRRVVIDALASMRRGMDEENFDEALANVRYAWTDTGAVTPEIAALVADERARDLTLESDKFWYLTAALREFIKREGCLPLEGSIPDMTSTTESYVELQRLYADKASVDARSVWRSATELAEKIGFLKPEEFITEYDAKTFCRNCRHVRFMEWRPLAHEFAPSADAGTSALLAEALADSTKTVSACIFAAFRASNTFSETCGRFPGVRSSEELATGDVDDFVREDADRVFSLMTEWFAASGTPLDESTTEVARDVAYEICRYANGQLYAVGAVLGGIASQELIKVITQQFTPMTRRLIYDAVHSTTVLLF